MGCVTMSEWIDYNVDWGYWINPDTFRMPRVKKSVRVGAIVLSKQKETLDTGQDITATYYGLAKDSGVEENIGKKRASEILVKQMLEYMKEKGVFPPEVSIKKIFKNGSVDLAYLPTNYDKFTLRFTPAVVGKNVEEFLEDLGQFQEDEQGADIAPSKDLWKVELAASGRAKCRTCGQAIAKDLIRLGEPGMYQDHVTYKWHHLDCAGKRISWHPLEKLIGYSELSQSDKDELKAKIGS